MLQNSIAWRINIVFVAVPLEENCFYLKKLHYEKIVKSFFFIIFDDVTHHSKFIKTNEISWKFFDNFFMNFLLLSIFFYFNNEMFFPCSSAPRRLRAGELATARAVPQPPRCLDAGKVSSSSAHSWNNVKSIFLMLSFIRAFSKYWRFPFLKTFPKARSVHYLCLKIAKFSDQFWMAGVSQTSSTTFSNLLTLTKFPKWGSHIFPDSHLEFAFGFI